MEGGCLIVHPVVSDKTAHVKKMVQKQSLQKTVCKRMIEAHLRSSVYGTPQKSSATADVAEAHCKQSKVPENVLNSLVSSTRSLTFDTAKGVYKKS